jgi:hypothetical protein
MCTTICVRACELTAEVLGHSGSTPAALRRQYLYFCTSKPSKLSSKHLNKRHGLSRHLFGHLSIGGFVTSDVSSGIRGLVSIGGLVKSAVESEV